MDSMNLFERYLQAVRKYLPWERQDDIVAELRANLESQREEREAELGRPLTEGEMIDWLKELGPPMQMAARYQPPRYLIGPNLFPLYWRILRLVLVLASAVYFIANIISAITQQHDSSWFVTTVANWPGFLLIPAAWVTGIFAVLEFVSERYPEKCPDFMAPASRWSPTTLPPLEKTPPFSGKPRSFTVAIAEFLGEFVLLLWVLLVPHFPFLLLGPGEIYLRNLPLTFAPVIVLFYWVLVAFSAIQLAWQAYELLSDNWRFRSPMHKLIIKGFGIVPIAILMAAPGHVFLKFNPAGYGHLPHGFDLATINHGIYSGVTVIAFIVLVQFLWDLYQAIRRTRSYPFAVLL